MADITKINNGTATYDVRDAAAVHNTGNESVSGTKTFTSSPVIPTVASTDDNSTKAASTGWVTSKLTAWWNAIKGAAATIGGTWTFSNTIVGHASQDALDNAVVKLSGSQTIDGNKTFQNHISLPVSSTEEGIADENKRVLGLTAMFGGNGASYIRFLKNSNNRSQVEIRLQTPWKGLCLESVSNSSSKLSTDVDSVKGSAFAAAGMPSSISVNLTLPESGGYVTVESSGYVFLQMDANANEYIKLSCGIENTSYASQNSQRLTVSIPVTKGANVYVYRTASGTLNGFKLFKSNAEVQ